MTVWDRLRAAPRALGFVVLLGVGIRVHHLLVKHDPRTALYSDMQMYVQLAQRLAAPGYAPRPEDVTHPPGAPLLFAFLYARDHSFGLAVAALLALTLCLPFAVGALGWVAFGKENGKLALGVASVYFPFVDYGGYFLAEIPMAVACAVTLTLFLVATRQASRASALRWSVAAGVAWSVAIAFKAVALPAMLSLAATYVLFHRGPGEAAPELAGRKRKLVVVAGLVAGAVPLVAAMSARCTRLNGGTACLISNKGAADFLLGHYGRIGTIAWTGGVEFGSPSAFMRGYTARQVVDFSITDGPANSAAAWRWIAANPADALLLSFQHVYDLFFGASTWPTLSVPMEASHYGFVVFLLLPTLFLGRDLVRAKGVRGFLAGPEALLLSPLLGVCAAVFLATGEPRYRIPFDTIFIVLAMELLLRRSPKERAS